MNPATIYRRIGLVSLTLIALAFSLAAPLRCIEKAILVGGVALCSGGLLGASLAWITRTRNPWLIYLALGIAALCFWPLTAAWPHTEIWDVRPSRTWPRFFYNYLDYLRGILFLVGIPYPFARFGQHTPDPRPDRLPSESHVKKI
jgi:hypothetical protein